MSLAYQGQSISVILFPHRERVRCHAYRIWTASCDERVSVSPARTDTIVES